VALGLGCFIRLLVLWFSRELYVVGTPDACLTSFALGSGLVDNWAQITRLDTAKVFSGWACIVAGSIYVTVFWDLKPLQTAMSITVFAFVSSVFGSLTLSMLHICQGMSLILDNFCVCFVSEQDCEVAVQEWNTLQAMLRRVCSSVARTHILLLTGALVATIVPILSNSSLWALIPGVSSLLCMVYVSLHVASVTSQCDRVPAFINTLDLGETLDYRRMYLVDYVLNSRAGFYMFEVRITSEMVLKAAYVGAMIAAAFITSRMSNA